MPLIVNEDSYTCLKNKVELAKQMKDKGSTYKEIGDALGVSNAMAWKYVMRGEELLTKYEPSEDENVKWEEKYQNIKKIVEHVPKVKDDFMRMYARETVHPKQFLRFVRKRLEEDRL